MFSRLTPVSITTCADCKQLTGKCPEKKSVFLTRNGITEKYYCVLCWKKIPEIIKIKNLII